MTRFRTTVSRGVVLVTCVLSVTIARADHKPGHNPGGGGGGGNGETAAYTIVPFLPGGFSTISSHVTDLNEGTGVVGFAELPSGGYAALHYDLLTNVYTSLTGNSPAAFGTNDLNQIVGTVAVGSDWGAVFWSDRFADPVPLGAMPGDVRSEALDINNDGVIVGYSQSGTQTTGVAWRVGFDEFGVLQVDGPVALPPLPGEIQTYARRVNELLDGVAQVAGLSRLEFGSRETVLWTLTLNPNGTLAIPGVPEGLGKLGLRDPSYSSPGGLNDLGDVCGDSDGRPFFAPAGQLAQPLPVPRDTQRGWAMDINNLGEIVGQLDIYKTKGFINGPGNYHPYLWHEGQMIDLEKEVDRSSGWDRLWAANVINDAGVIAGFGRFDVEFRGFLLLPNGPQ